VGHGGRPAGMRGWQRKMVEYEHWHKIKRKKCRSLGCGLQFGGAKNDLLTMRLRSSNTLFSAARTSNSRCLVLKSKDAMRVSFYFERSCPEQRPASRCIEAPSPKSPTRAGSGQRALDPGRRPAEVLASRGVVVVESRRASGKLQELPS
jgi:hypothetical protein